MNLIDRDKLIEELENRMRSSVQTIYGGVGNSILGWAIEIVKEQPKVEVTE